MSSIPTKQIDGDVAVGRNVSAGGNANVQGNVRIGHDLKVEGWFDAKNIKGPVKGLFLSEAKLKATYQFPEEGWYALVGTTLPAALYVTEGGEWKSTGQNAGSPETDLTEYRAELEELQGKVENNELQSVSVTAGNNSATLTVKSKGKTVSCAVPVANSEHGGIITFSDFVRIGTADKRDGTYPIETVVELKTDTTLEIPESNAVGVDNLLQAVMVDDTSKIYPHVVTDGDALQLWVYVYATQVTYFADAWGDMPELGIASTRRYKQAAALLVDVINSKLYMWSDDQSSLLALVTEGDKGIEGGIATLGADGKVPAAQMPQDVYAVQGYDSDMDAAGVTVSDSEITANYRVVWLANADGTGRFAAEAVPAAVGQPLHARWPGSERMCGANGKPRPGKLYIRKSDMAIMTVADGGQKLERAGGDDIDAIKGAAGGIAPLGADGKVPAAYLPAQEATIRFAEVVRQPGAAIDSGQPTGTFSVVWLDNSAATDYAWKAPGAEETPLAGRFVARVQSIPVDPGPGVEQAESESGGDVGSTVTYHADWEGRSEVCNSNGSPLILRTYLCAATGRQYDRPASGTGLRCIAAPPMDAKKALLADLWNEASCNDGWGGNPATRTVHGHYDPDTDKWLLNELSLSYAEAIAVWYAGTPRGYDAVRFYGGQHTIRTNLPIRVDASNGPDFSSAFLGCTNLEVAFIGPRVINGNNMFHGTSKLKKVIGEMKLNVSSCNPSVYITCPVEEMNLGWWGTGSGSYNLSNLPNLNAASLEWMISGNIAGASVRSVTLHADAYARLTDDMLARAAEKNITFISAA